MMDHDSSPRLKKVEVVLLLLRTTAFLSRPCSALFVSKCKFLGSLHRPPLERSVFSPSVSFPKTFQLSPLQVAWAALHKASDVGNAASTEALLKGIDLNARSEVIDMTRTGETLSITPRPLVFTAAADGAPASFQTGISHIAVAAASAAAAAAAASEAVDDCERLCIRLDAFAAYRYGGLCERVPTADVRFVHDYTLGVRTSVVAAIATVHGDDAEDALTIAQEFDVTRAVQIVINSAIAPAISIACNIDGLASARADPTGAIALAIGKREMTRIILNSGCDSTQLAFTLITSGPLLGPCCWCMQAGRVSDDSEGVNCGTVSAIAKSRGSSAAPASQSGCGTTGSATMIAPAAVGNAADGGGGLFASSAVHMRVCVPEHLMPSMCRRVRVLADLLGLDAHGIRSGLQISVSVLQETRLAKSIPELDRGRRFCSPTILRVPTADHPSDGKAFVSDTFKSQQFIHEGVLHEAPHADFPIPLGDSQCTSLRGYVQIGVGGGSEVFALSSAHDTRMDSIGPVTLECASVPVAEGASGGLSLRPIMISNPWQNRSEPAQVCGTFVSNVRSMPGSAPDAPQPDLSISDVASCIADCSLYRIISEPGDAPRSDADVELVPHLECLLHVQDVIRRIPCLPPSRGPGSYTGQVYFNGDVERGSSSSAVRLLDVVGFAEKHLRVRRAGALTSAVEVTYLGRCVWGTEAPALGDSGGKATQCCADKLLHSFISAEVQLDRGTARQELFYTLTPAGCVLETVRAWQAVPGSLLPQGALRFVRPLALP